MIVTRSFQTVPSFLWVLGAVRPTRINGCSFPSGWPHHSYGSYGYAYYAPIWQCPQNGPMGSGLSMVIIEVFHPIIGESMIFIPRIIWDYMGMSENLGEHPEILRLGTTCSILTKITCLFGAHTWILRQRHFPDSQMVSCVIYIYMYIIICLYENPNVY